MMNSGVPRLGALKIHEIVNLLNSGVISVLERSNEFKSVKKIENINLVLLNLLRIAHLIFNWSYFITFFA